MQLRTVQSVLGYAKSETEQLYATLSGCISGTLCSDGSGLTGVTGWGTANEEGTFLFMGCIAFGQECPIRTNGDFAAKYP